MKTRQGCGTSRFDMTTALRPYACTTRNGWRRATSAADTNKERAKAALDPGTVAHGPGLEETRNQRPCVAGSGVGGRRLVGHRCSMSGNLGVMC